MDFLHAPPKKKETHMKSTQITVQRRQVTFDGVAKRTRICQAEMRKKKQWNMKLRGEFILWYSKNRFLQSLIFFYKCP